MRTLRPQLPNYKLLARYLERVDESRYYSNSGPLVLEYERRMSEHFNAYVVSTASATAGLTACLIAQQLAPHTHVAVPSWTFVATAASICAAGLTPYFVDVAPHRGNIAHLNHDVQCIVMTAPYGNAVDTGWVDRIAPSNDCSIIIDAAAGFDTVTPGRSPIVVSTHATKVFGTGEGGLVISTDPEVVEQVREIANFGLQLEANGYDRNAEFTGINGKMSEYHAAVGLAELDGWGRKREQWIGAKQHYEDLFEDFSTPAEGKWATSQFPIRVETDVELVIERMEGEGVAMRKVWGDGVHKMDAYKHFPRSPLPGTDRLARETLFLPFGVDMTREEAKQVYDAVMESL